MLDAPKVIWFQCSHVSLHLLDWLAMMWAFAELRRFLDYKAILAGSLCVKVDADYTSQACPHCGYTSKANRPKQALLFEGI